MLAMGMGVRGRAGESAIKQNYMHQVLYWCPPHVPVLVLRLMFRRYRAVSPEDQVWKVKDKEAEVVLKERG